MGRLMAIDYGRKRCGIAVTDPLRIVATGLATVATSQLIEFISKYASTEVLDGIIVGLPRTVQGELSESMNYITPGVNRLKKVLPDIPVTFFDERFTSVIAHRSMLDSGMKKTQRRDKAIVDEIAATIILNDYLQSKTYNDLNK